MASLLVVSGPGSGDYYLLRGSAVIVGRDDDCHIQIVDPAVSRRHVEVRPAGEAEEGHVAADLGSSNGTLVNDRPADGRTPLADGDVLRLGTTEILYSAVDFADGETAFQHYRRRGERSRRTIVTGPAPRGGRP